MNWPNKRLCSGMISTIAVALQITGCGVKGDPLPPEKPVDLGRGRPTYKRATEGLKIEKNKALRSRTNPAKKEDEDEDGER